MKVSVLIPLYNSEDYISETVESVLQQTFRNLEIIIVDDGSTDRSYEIAKNYKSDIVQVITQSNRGASAARNKAFELSTGDLIQYLDADDILHPNKIEMQVQLYNSLSSNMIIINGRWGRFSGSKEQVQWECQEIDKNYEQPLNWLLDSWGGKGMAQPGAWLTPRELILKAGPWNEDLSLNDDGEFFCRVLLEAENIIFSEKSKVYYRSGNEKSLSNTLSDGALYSQFKSIKSYFFYFKERGLLKGNEKIFSSLFQNFLYSYSQMRPKLVEEVVEYLYSQKINMKTNLYTNNLFFRLFIPAVGFKNTILLRNYVKQKTTTFSSK